MPMRLTPSALFLKILFLKSCLTAFLLASASLANAQATSWQYCANENNTCTFSGAKLVRYGAGTVWTQRLQINSVSCNNATFGDPLPGTYKRCEIAEPQWTTCANENQTCTFSGKKIVRYGADTRWRQGEFTNQVECRNSVFGDPAVGTFKSCQIANGANDTTAPTPPTNLRLSNLTCTSATLSWNAATDDIAVSAYDVYYDGQFMVNVDGTKLYAVLTLVPGANWGLYVNAVDAAGNVSQASTTLQVGVPQCETDVMPPTTPTNVEGAATGTSVTLSWTASTDNVQVTGYDIYRNNAKVGTTPDLTYVDSGLTANTTYQYSIAARDGQENVSARSANISVTTGSVCSSPVCSVEQVTTDTDIPWGLVALPDGSILYSRRDAHDIIRLHDGIKTTVGTIPNVESTDGEGGLLGLAVTPDFPADDPWLYIFHTSATDNRVVRIQYINDELDLSTQEVLLTGILRNKFHDGGRLRFGPDGKLYVATGDAQAANSAQDINSLNGKILRMNPDGSVPSDNPFSNYVWTYGHRNPQGLAFDSSGRLWQQEFGDGSLDETNLLEKGGNYGWPICEGTLSKSGSGCATSGFIAPKKTYRTADASCSGIAILEDVLYIACLRGNRVYRHDINGSDLINSQQLFVGTYGRIRTVEPSIEGDLWMTTSNNGDKDSTPNNSNEEIFKVYLNR